MRLQKQASLVILLTLFFGLCATIKADETSVIRQGVIEEDIYLAGTDVTVDGQAQGDVIVGAEKINIKGDVVGDVIAAGAEIHLEAELHDDVRLVGGKIFICSLVKGDAAIAGADISFCDKASIGGNSFITGKNLTLDGVFDGDLTAHANTLKVSGQISGKVNLSADDIELLPGTSISGDLEYKSPSPAKIHDGVVIGGEEIYSVSEANWWTGVASDPKSWAGIAMTFMLVGVIGITIAALALSYIFPGVIQSATRSVQQHFLANLGLGVVVAIGVPIGALLLLITIVGAPLALLSLVALILMFMGGFYISLLCIADMLTRIFNKHKSDSKVWRLLMVALASLFITLVSIVPIVGGIMILLVYMTGLGALFRVVRDAQKNNIQTNST